MIRFKTIHSRIFSILSLLIALSAVVIYVYMLYDLKTKTYKSFDSVTQTINNALVDNIRGYVYNKDTDNIQHSIDAIKSEYIHNILILDTNGNILSAQKHSTKYKRIYKHFKALKHSSSLSLKDDGRYIILNTFKLLEVTLGYLVVEGNTKHYLSELNEKLSELIILILSLFFIAIVVAYYLSKSISKPLNNIIETLYNTQDNELLVFKQESEEEFKYLTKSIEEKHNALLHLNAQLEDEVNIKIVELQNLNQTLEQKISDAVHDAQEKEQLFQQQARLAQMGEMISMIAHQWRQPLAAIASAMMVIDRNIETDKFDLDNNNDREKFFLFLEEKHESIQQNIQHLSSTTEDFRDFFNPNTEQDFISINEPVEKALNLMKTSISNNGIKITTDINSKKKCHLYQNKVMQVILNILKNASDALIGSETNNKYIEIYTYDTQNEAIVKICDNGIGMSKEVEEKIFDPYFSTKGEKIGTGLGLYMSKTIIEEHNNGKIELYTDHEKTCFILRFPL